MKFETMAAGKKEEEVNFWADDRVREMIHPVVGTGVECTYVLACSI